jgi:hypothetical protein
VLVECRWWLSMPMYIRHEMYISLGMHLGLDGNPQILYRTRDIMIVDL